MKKSKSKSIPEYIGQSNRAGDVTGGSASKIYYLP
jgi:hypothetical protein